MKYILEIRDLTNESRSLKEAKKDFNIQINDIKKDIEITAKNHVVAMGEYLKHMHREVLKITDSLSTEGFGVRVYFRKEYFTLYIRDFSAHCDMCFKYDSEHGLVHERYLVPLSNPEMQKLLLHLVKEWGNLKSDIQKAINSYLANENKTMKKNIESATSAKEALDSFKI